jgi:hypothetical protein
VRRLPRIFPIEGIMWKFLPKRELDISVPQWAAV